MYNKIVIVILLLSIIGFLIALYALLIQVFGIQSTEKATIISGLLSMIGGAIGALGAYFVASSQMDKQFEHEKKKEERQRKETIEHTLKNLELLNIEIMSFIEYFVEEFAKPYNEQRVVQLEFSIKNISWIVDNVNRVNPELLKGNYSISYLRFSRELYNMYIDIVGINYLPDEQKPSNLLLLIKTLLKRDENFKSFDQYVKEQIKNIQKQMEI